LIVTSPSAHPSNTPELSRVLATFAGTRAASHAESWLQLFVLDGVLEAAEWAAQGVGADDVACGWLGALRWVRALDGELPDGAPVPPQRTFASQAAEPARAAGPGDPQNLVGLRSPEMSQPRRPFNRPAATVPQLASTDGTGVLARAAALGLLAHAGEEDVRRLASWTAAFSHGSPAAHEAAADAAALLHALTRTGALPHDAVRVLDDVAGAATDEAEASTAVGPFETAREGLRAAVVAARPAVAGKFGAHDWARVQELAERDRGAGAYAGALIGAVLGVDRLQDLLGQDVEELLGGPSMELAIAFTRAALG
jgi:hypothetical protein